MEMTARKPSDQQMWAVHFDDWSRMSPLYANFITGEKEAREHIRTVLSERQGMEDNYLHSILRDSLRLLFLPSQRLPKYSGFLQVRPLFLPLPLFLYGPYSAPPSFTNNLLNPTRSFTDREGFPAPRCLMYQLVSKLSKMLCETLMRL